MPSPYKGFLGGKTKRPGFDLFIHWLINQITNTCRNHFSRSCENCSIKRYKQQKWSLKNCTFQSSSFFFIHSFFCICCVIYTFFSLSGHFFVSLISVAVPTLCILINFVTQLIERRSVFLRIQVRANTQTKGLRRGWKQRARLGRDARNTNTRVWSSRQQDSYAMLNRFWE